MGGIPEGDALVVRIASFFDALSCSRQGERYAGELGFGTREAWEVSIVVSELATNIVRHAGSGRLVLRPLEAGEGIEIIAEDDGPGFGDIEAALVDGYSEGRLLEAEVLPCDREGLGAGLGAVRRLMDSVAVTNRRTRGARVVARKTLPGRSVGKRDPGGAA